MYSTNEDVYGVNVTILDFEVIITFANGEYMVHAKRFIDLNIHIFTEGAKHVVDYNHPVSAHCNQLVLAMWFLLLRPSLTTGSYPGKGGPSPQLTKPPCLLCVFC